MSDSMRRLRVGVILPGFSADETDWCIPVQLNLVRRLAQPAEVRVFPLRYPHTRKPYTISGATVVPQGGAAVSGIQRALLLQRAIATLVAQHRRAPFDVLHAMWADEPGVVAVLAGRLLRVPVVASLLGGELIRMPEIGYGAQLSALSRVFVRTTLRGAQRVLAGSQYLRHLAGPFVPSERLVSLALGVDTARFQPQGERANLRGAIRLFHAASLVPVKDQATLLRAFALVAAAEPGTHLHIAGAGPLREALLALCDELAITEQVTFHGALTHTQVPAYHRAANLHVLASRHEGQELTTLEAAACARPTVGTAVGLLPDLAPQRAVPVGDHVALGRTLLATIRDDLVARGQADYQAMHARYSLDCTLEQLLHLYHQLTTGGRTA